MLSHKSKCELLAETAAVWRRAVAARIIKVQQRGNGDKSGQLQAKTVAAFSEVAGWRIEVNRRCPFWDDNGDDKKSKQPWFK